MQIQDLPVQKRVTLGSAASRRYRRERLIPCILYGNKQENVPLTTTVDAFDKVLKSHSVILRLRLGEQEQTALLRRVDWDALGEWVHHVDFVRIEMHDEVKVSVPMRYIGIPAGIGQGGVPEVVVADMDVFCRADSIPDEIRVDVTAVELDQGVYAHQVTWPQNVRPVVRGKGLLFHVVQARKIEEVKPAAAEAVAEGAEAAAAGAAAGGEAAPAGKAEKGAEKPAAEKGKAAEKPAKAEKGKKE